MYIKSLTKYLHISTKKKEKEKIDHISSDRGKKNHGKQKKSKR
jgi:hypothetical protein